MSSSNYLFKSNNYIITTIIIVLLSLLWLLLLQLLFWLILPVELFLKNQVGESSKQGIQVAWSTPIYHVKWWISRFRGIYRTLAASEVGLFLMLLKGLWPLCNVTRGSIYVSETTYSSLNVINRGRPCRLNSLLGTLPHLIFQE